MLSLLLFSALKTLSIGFAVYGWASAGSRSTLTIFKDSTRLGQVSCYDVGNYVPAWHGIAVIDEDGGLALADYRGKLTKISGMPSFDLNDRFAVSPDGKTLGVCRDDLGELDLYQIPKLKLVWRVTRSYLRSHGIKTGGQPVFDPGVCFSSDGRTVASSFPSLGLDSGGLSSSLAVTLKVKSGGVSLVGKGQPVTFSGDSLVVRQSASQRLLIRGRSVRLAEATWVGGSNSDIVLLTKMKEAKVSVWSADLKRKLTQFTMEEADLPRDFDIADVVAMDD